MTNQIRKLTHFKLITFVFILIVTLLLFGCSKSHQNTFSDTQIDVNGNKLTKSCYENNKSVVCSDFALKQIDCVQNCTITYASNRTMQQRCFKRCN